MRENSGLGLGSFFIGLGASFLLFQGIDVTRHLFAWITIVMGAMIVASTLISRWRRISHLGGVVRGLAGGLVLSLVVTSGFGFSGSFGVSGSGGFRVSETRVLDGSMTADRLLVDADIFNGGVEVSTWDRDEYQFTALIRAKGASDEDAQSNLEALELDLDESTVLGKRKLVLRHNISPMRTTYYSISLEVKLPADAVIDLNLDSSNGGFTLLDMSCGEIELDTSNGGVTFYDVTADTVLVDTSNGWVRGDLDAADVNVDTSNGGIQLTLPSTRSGRYVLDTSNGPIYLDLSASPEVGYDQKLSTSNGGISIDLPDMVYSLNRDTRKEARTDGFAMKAVEIAIDASTSNGGMDIGI
ncbi:hypothetical protein E2P65_04755 [Candidatus Bathyarchaeota archaeon]|nr:hypothetical protein E2P65_04755 [Candidatus Bathyarchaeota archaeon]